MKDGGLSRGQLVGGDFEIIRELGSGGMGSVYLARQVSTGSPRALKVMRERLSGDPEFVRRFHLEAQATARIRSRHVVQVVQANVDERLGGLPWIAMEYLEGTTLDRVMAAFGPPSALDGELLLQQLFHGLGAAHDAHLVHRDLKPENLLLARGDGPGAPFTLKVLDFGIAKWLTRGSAVTTERLLTPLWGAPEQSIPGAIVGPHTDVWALGLLVFWLLTGRSFWHLERGGVALQEEIHRDPIPPASRRAAELGVPAAFDAPFDAWFAHCVVRETSARFSHAREAELALRGLALPFPPTASPWRAEAGLPMESAPTEIPLASAPTEQAKPSSRSAPGARLSPSTTARPVAATGGVSRAAPSRSSTVRRVPWVLALLAVTGATALVLTERLRTSSSRGVAARSSANAHLSASAGSKWGVTVPTGMRAIPAGRLPAGEARAAATGRAGEAVAVAAFVVDTTEVDVAHYAACVAAGRCTESRHRSWDDGPVPPAFDELCNARHQGRSNHPVNCVDKRQARAYCAFVGKRLPTEHEWEYAARGADGRLYPWGDDPPRTCDTAVVSGLCARQPESTRAVGSRAPSSASPFGLADQSGNVWEWVESPVKGGVLKGGAWDYPAERATAVARLVAPETRADASTGFRCALSTPEP